RAAHLGHADRRRGDLLRADDLRELPEPLVDDRGHADVAGRTRPGQRLEQRRLAGAGESDDPDLERHQPQPSTYATARAPKPIWITRPAAFVSKRSRQCGERVRVT